MSKRERPKEDDSQEASFNDRFIYELIKGRYDFENQNSLSLGTKAANVIGWNGLVVSILSTATGILFNKEGVGFLATSIEVYLLIGTLALLLGSLSISLVAYAIKVKYALVPEPNSLIKGYKNKSHTQTLRTVSGTLADTIEFNSERNYEKDRDITIALLLFLFGISLAAGFIAVQLIRHTL